MKWRELADLLGKEAQKCGLGLGHELAWVLKAKGPELLALQNESKNAIDAAVFQFSQSRTWPELDLKKRAILTRRLIFAEGIVRLLASAKATDGERIAHDSTCTEPALIEWALIDSWENYELVRSQVFC
jgi:hypothetical protein